MAVNKNFVVKNGLEVNTNLILADATNDRVGIGTTVPSYTLDVAGGIGATSMYIAGVTTALGNIKIGSAGTTLTAIGNSVGVGTDAPAYLLDVRSAVSTGQTALYVYGDMRVSGDINLDDIILDDVRATDLYITGLSTFVGLTSALDVRVGAALSVVGVSTFNDSVRIPDNKKLHFGNIGGAFGDLQIWHDAGEHSYIRDQGSGDLRIYGSAIDIRDNAGTSSVARFNDDGVTIAGDVTITGVSTFTGNIDANGDLDVDGTTNLDVLDVDGATNFGADVTFAGDSYNVFWDKSADSLEFRDEALAIFGTNNDLKISHTNSLASQNDSEGNSVVDGWTSYIEEAGTGGLVFKSNGNTGEGCFQFFDTSWKPIVRMFSGDNARPVLYHAGSPRLETTGIGVSVQGSVGIRTNLEVAGITTLANLEVAGITTFGGANIVAAGGTFQVGAGGTVFYVDTDGTLTIGSATTLATVSLNGGSIPSIGLVIALGG